MIGRVLLGPTDPLPSSARRLLVLGCSGSGKTTLARELAGRTGIPYTDLDGLFHGPDWVERPEFEADVRALAAGSAWITEFGYGKARPHLLPRGEVLIWLDPPRWRVMAQIVPRTLRRRLGRIPLWNGNVEPPFHTFLTDPDHIVRWAWKTYPKSAARVRRVLAVRPELPVVRLGSRAEIAAWLSGPAAALG